eukprot:tig00020960_g16552.t1
MTTCAGGEARAAAAAAPEPSTSADPRVAGIRRVAVVGAGPCGLAVAKELQAAGFSVTVFEQNADVGGIWLFSPDESHSSVYKNMVTNTSKQLMCYSDFPMPSEYPTFLHHTQVLSYVKSYASHFGLYDVTRFRTSVRRVREEPDRSFRLAWRDERTGLEGEDAFDAVCVANGHNSSPSTPSFPGADGFGGTSIHSHVYKDPEAYAGQRVLVVGSAASGLEIAGDVARAASHVYVASRGASLVRPHFVDDCPIDQFSRNRFFRRLPPRLRTAWAHWRLERAVGGFRARFGLPGPAEARLPLFLSLARPSPSQAAPQADENGSGGGISSEFLRQRLAGRVEMVAGVQRFEGGGSRSVLLSDGSSLEIDTVIYCTGYNYEFPFLDPSCGVEVAGAKWARGILKDVFLARNPRLSFACLGSQVIPFPLAELQGRWIAGVYGGRLSLPPQAEVEAEVAREETRRARLPAKLAHRTDHVAYCDALAELVGATPRTFRPESPRLTWALLWGPVVPFVYRLDGPGRWEGAEEAVLEAVYGPRRPAGYDVRDFTLEAAPGAGSLQLPPEAGPPRP